MEKVGGWGRRGWGDGGFSSAYVNRVCRVDTGVPTAAATNQSYQFYLISPPPDLYS